MLIRISELTVFKQGEEGHALEILTFHGHLGLTKPLHIRPGLRRGFLK
jgi:hypothetical protein